MDDLTEFIKKVKNLLAPGGQFAAFFTFKKQVGDAGNKLDPKSNRLGKALTNAGFKFQTYDFSSNDKVIWENVNHFAKTMKEAFLEEGYPETYAGRIKESEHQLKTIYEGRSARYYYLTEGVE